jgi:hypothetical protein
MTRQALHENKPSHAVPALPKMPNPSTAPTPEVVAVAAAAGLAQPAGVRSTRNCADERVGWEVEECK